MPRDTPIKYTWRLAALLVAALALLPWMACQNAGKHKPALADRIANSKRNLDWRMRLDDDIGEGIEEGYMHPSGDGMATTGEPSVLGFYSSCSVDAAVREFEAGQMSCIAVRPFLYVFPTGALRLRVDWVTDRTRIVGVILTPSGTSKAEKDEEYGGFFDTYTHEAVAKGQKYFVHAGAGLNLPDAQTELGAWIVRHKDNGLFMQLVTGEGERIEARRVVWIVHDANGRSTFAPVTGNPRVSFEEIRRLFGSSEK